MRVVLGFFRDVIRRSPARTAVLVFAFAALVFTALLSLPIASANRQITPLSDAFFTAVSAVTVTGLTTVNTADHWSLFGEIVILAAIQVGALGVVTIALLFARVVTKRLGLSSKIMAREMVGASDLGDVWRLLRIVLAVTFIAEGALMAVLIPAFIVADGDWLIGIWHGIFYAISAFGNAGFVVHSGGLADLDGNYVVLGAVAIGVFVGSFGFPVFLNFVRAKWMVKHWSLHTKLTLVTTSILLVVGMAGWLVTEWANPATLGDRAVGDRLFQGLFASINMRSGGFHVVDTSEMSTASMLITDAMMFVGGGSASTAGGIKVTTLAVLFLAIVAEAKGTHHVMAARRRIPEGALRVAISVTFLGASLVLGGSLLIAMTNNAQLADILFEVISAFATCGLSVGLSAELDGFGKIVLSILMLTGRVGPIALAASLTARQRDVHFTYPEERPIIG
ncbi:TrkH family potassium uptake protein [Microbacterium amylolyticum]|uniref:Trk-type K+ transport system membrane component n=1 Tax=Microbacterium amylolyticum TaxID=936337 RepID=A0ABS4ZJ68_9MICO|nr:TrkH family potassium uptake protein [Microbacterium amylolyticum]MBP2437316.1 Trk-type K+ transport system membrane component [Microbacterium amylolyticum]